MVTNNTIRDRNAIQSLARGLNILELCAKSPRPLTLTEIANRAQLTKTTAQRFLNTLCALGYLRREENKSYVLAARVLSLAYSFMHTSSLVTMAKPFLDELSAQLDKTVNLAVLEDVHTLILYRKEVRKFMKYDLGPGSKLPCYAGSLGKAMLAGLNDKALKARLNKIEFYPITPKTVSSKQALWNEIREIRKRGYSICDQELSLDMYSIGVPLLDRQGQVVAAINASMEFSFKDNPKLEALIGQLLEKGKMISYNLGYNGPYPVYPL
ncbi:MAG: IclR family transcriptional regulator [Thermodesulfobacteriota bacterium]